MKKTKTSSSSSSSTYPTTMTLSIVLGVVVVVFLLGINAEASTATATATATREEEDYTAVIVDDSNNNSSNNDSTGISMSNFVSPLMITSSSRDHDRADSDHADALDATTTTTATSTDTTSTSTSNMLRGGGKGEFEFKSKSKFNLPPIPPFHPHHSGTVHYSSIQNADNGAVTYRREINAPCDYGMLVFTVGYAAQELPYEYDLYEEAYLWSDNGGLCILYPSYNGYQTSTTPFWKLGLDPDTVTFTNLIINPSSMHHISSRDIIGGGRNSDTDNKIIGDYIIMSHHNFYNINYYKQLKSYINSLKTSSSTFSSISIDNINIDININTTMITATME